MSGPKDNGGDDERKPGGTWPPDSEYAVPTGSPDVYDPGYVPPPADPEHDNRHADEGPPAALYPDAVAPDAPATSYDPGVSDTSGAMGSSGVVDAGGLPTSSSGVVAPYPPSSASSAYEGFGPPMSVEEPLLPAELAAPGALLDAVGASSANARRRAKTEPRRDDDDGDGLAPPRSKRTMIMASTSIIVGLGIATLVFLGHANAQRYVLFCDAARAFAEQGRSFPPWGTHALRGPEWAPVPLPANAECQPRETDDPAELSKWYLELLVDRANTTLTARDLLDNVGGANNQAVNRLDVVSAQLDQALLLARDPDRRDQRKEITRLQGDVDYWRAAARLRDASAVLLDSAKQFESANQRHPRHATDAAAWSEFLHHLADELHAGPNGAVPIATGAPATNAAVTGTTPVPVGTALPVEAEGSGSATPQPPDAGVPSGGVLL